MNEADTCRKYVVPKLQAAGWENEPHSITEQRSFTDGRIIVVGSKARRQKQKRTDYLLRFTRDYPIAVVEAKASYKTPGDGLQQAKEYAAILGLKFAYATNGMGRVAVVSWDMRFLSVAFERKRLDPPPLGTHGALTSRRRTRDRCRHGPETHRRRTPRRAPPRRDRRAPRPRRPPDHRAR
jgi:hypothetical protein